MNLLDAVIDTDYGQFDLMWGPEPSGFDGDFDRFFANQLNGLVGAAEPTGLYINLARRSGGSAMRIELLAHEPANGATREWEDVVEVSVDVPAGSEPRWESWAAMSSGALALPPGSYRVRVSARGRDTGHQDEFADGVVDWYLVELWQAPRSPDAILKVGTDDARYWHREIGGRR